MPGRITGIRLIAKIDLDPPMNEHLPKPGHLPATTLQTDSLPENGPDRTEPYLIVVSGNDRGKHYNLYRQQTVLGRDPQADIVMTDPKMSRRHGLFTVFPDGILLEDLNSSNGTFVGGLRIASHKLDSRDRIRIGDTQMRVDYKKPGEAEADQALYQAANTDALTGILNRGAFMRRAEEEISYCKRHGGRLSVVICDVDHFKQKNDNFGHLAGDRILMELAEILGQEMRREDLLARYGGEEFIMLLREPAKSVAANWAERIRNKVMLHPFAFQEQAIPTTISIGLCCRQAEAIVSLQAVIQSADEALYRAKHNGRNRVELAEA